ncbi:hypothetical protein J6E39_04010 [bacterium]|nr:hypothetical protein [bacterium]
MRISATNSLQTNNNYNQNFTALNLGKKNPIITKETRDLADKAVDVFESVMTNPMGLNKFTDKGCEASLNSLFGRKYLKLNKKTPDGRVNLSISSEKPRQAEITMSIKSDSEYTQQDMFYNSNYNSVSVNNGTVKKEDIEDFKAYKTTIDEVLNLEPKDVLGSFTKNLSEFLNLFE